MEQLKYFSLFTGIGGFERAIEQWYESLCNADRGENRGSKEYTEGNERQRLFPTQGKGAVAEERPVGERPENIAYQRPLCVGYSEIDKYAMQIYSRHYPTHKNYGDITKINENELPDFDLLVGGFPCQSFSIAGKRGGFGDTRGTLFFDIARIVKAKQPRFLVLENVKGLLSHDQGRTFRTIICALDELGYDLQWQVLNSKDFGVPQNRERIFIVGHLRAGSRPEVFPFIGEDEFDVRETATAERAVVGTLRTHKDGNGFRESKSGLVPTIPARAREDGSGQAVLLVGSPKYGDGKRSVSYKQSKNAPTIRATQHKSGDNQPVIVQRSRGNNAGGEHDIAPTLTGNSYDHNNHLKDGYSIRRLTPVECERLQGFPDYWTRRGLRFDTFECKDKITVISDTQRYKCLGNAVTVNVVQAIITRLMNSYEKEATHRIV